MERSTIKSPSPYDARYSQNKLENGHSFEGSTTNGNSAAMNGHDRQQDKVIGLQFTNGQIFYLFQSTLIKTGYFAKRLNKDNSLNGDASDDDESRDAMNRTVYFVERNASLFENHILPFLLTDKPGKLPPFSKDRELWRLLRQEATFYQLPKLTELLYVTNICSPNTSLGRGVFYYLGTNHGTSSHWNPHALGAISVSRDTHYISPDKIDDKLGISATTNNDEDKKVLVQYRPTVTSIQSFKPTWTAVIGLSKSPLSAQSRHGDCCQILSWCRPKPPTRIPTVVILRSISLRLIAYSLHEKAHGMSEWKLEGSNNGIDWNEIHTANPATGCTWTQKEKQAWKRELEVIKSDIMVIPQETDPLEKIHVILDQEENSRRKIYEIESPSKEFYKYFQLVAIEQAATSTDHHEGHEEENSDSNTLAMTRRALHGVGLELFGEIHEE